MGTLLVLLSVTLRVVSNVAIKHGVRTEASATRHGIALRMIRARFVILGYAIYGIAMVIWFLALQTVDLSYAFPFVSLVIVATPILAWRLFQERISRRRAIGIGVVSLGVLVVSLSGLF